jgi:hypothetical protein
VEGNFDALTYRCGLTVRAKSGAKAPSADGFDSLFVQTEPQALGYANISGASISGNDGNQQNRALIFRFHRFI